VARASATVPRMLQVKAPQVDNQPEREVGTLLNLASLGKRGAVVRAAVADTGTRSERHQDLGFQPLTATYPLKRLGKLLQRIRGGK
jgi:hypothetical protein